MASKDNVFICVKREGAFASIEGWYTPVKIGPRTFTQDEVDAMRHADQQWIEQLCEANNKFFTKINDLEEKLSKIEDVINPNRF